VNLEKIKTFIENSFKQLLGKIKLWHQQCQTSDEKKKRIFISSLFGILLLIILICVLVPSCSSRPKNKRSQIVGKFRSPITSTPYSSQQTINLLKQIQTSLKKIQTQPRSIHTGLPKNTFNQLNQQLSSIQSTLTQLPTQQETKTTQNLIKHNTKNIAVQINQIEKLLTDIKEKIILPHYLSIKKLPFKAVDARTIAGILNVIIETKYGYLALIEHDHYGQWQVNHITANPKEVIFENAHKQLIKVNLES